MTDMMSNVRKWVRMVNLGAEPVSTRSARGQTVTSFISAYEPRDSADSTRWWLVGRFTRHFIRWSCSGRWSASVIPTSGRLAAMTRKCLLAAVALVAVVTREFDDFYLCDVMKLSSRSRLKLTKCTRRQVNKRHNYEISIYLNLYFYGFQSNIWDVFLYVT